MELTQNLPLGARMVKLISPFTAASTKEEAFTHLAAVLESDPEHEAKSIYACAKELGAFALPAGRRRSDALEAILETAQGGNAIRSLRTQVLSDMLRAHVPPETSGAALANVIPLRSRAPLYT